MVGVFSFLLVVSAVAFVVSAVLLVVRAVKKKPKKPVAVMAAASVLLFVISFVGIGVTYNPTPEQIAERERIAAEKAAEKEERERQQAEEAARKEAEEAARREAEEAARLESAAQSAPAESQTPAPAPSESAPASAPSESVPASPSESVPASPSAPESVTPSAPVESGKPEQPAAPSEPVETAPAEPEPDFIEENRTGIVVSAKMVLDRFISNYKIPLATQLWTIAKFDNVGAIAAMADITNQSTDATVTAIVVLTPIVEDGKMTGSTPHFVSVGDTVYGDDGYCDDVFSILAGIGSGQ